MTFEDFCDLPPETRRRMYDASLDPPREPVIDSDHPPREPAFNYDGVSWYRFQDEKRKHVDLFVRQFGIDSLKFTSLDNDPCHDYTFLPGGLQVFRSEIPERRNDGINDRIARGTC